MSIAPTRAQVRDELAVIVTADAARLIAVYGVLPEPLHDVHVERLPIWRKLDGLYGYAVEGRLAADFALNQILDELNDYFLENVARSALIDAYAARPVRGFCAWVVFAAISRWAMDFVDDHVFGIAELAALAGIEESDALAAISTRSAMPLCAYRDVEGYYQVAKVDAVAWLTTQPGYQRTVMLSPGETRFERTAFDDMADLHHYVVRRCEETGQTLAGALDAAGLGHRYTDWVRGCVDGVPELGGVQRLARVLGIHDRAFVLAACKAMRSPSATSSHLLPPHRSTP
ncbi:hypothetical protein GCM10007242_06260 [Pigmentiphaga litoralis]|uniref:hypothetical protein n=1 Tax=Pigmentiphaga litoralis TaxID=516702 RepID=UPI001673113E|nr:hypothetical protein [Pigmentiphaga litoralis]GGX03902.1 hypothetical protein GCM10007242_06260 [Pigmentiphaga litoralis]